MIHRFLLFSVYILISGCSTSDYVKQSEFFSSQLANTIEADLIDESIDETTRLTFKQACLEAARNDRNIVTTLEKFKQANVEADGVNTHLWPRLMFRANSEIPFNQSDDTDFELNGGFYFNYDIRKAIAVKDESILQKVVADQSRCKLNIAVNVLIRKLKNHLSRISFLTYKEEKKLQAQKLSVDAFNLAKVYAQQKRLDLATLASWKKRIDLIEFELASLRNQLIAEQYAIADMLGRSVTQTVTITDTETILSEYSIIQEEEYTPSMIWNNHSEARLYVLEQIAAEAGAQLIALERLPEVNAELGYGDIPLDNSIENTSSLLSLTVSMPLYDFGDHSRNVAKADITRNRVRKSMKSNITKLFNRAQMAKSAYLMAKENLSHTMSSVNQAKTTIAQKDILILEIKGDNLSLYPDKIELINLEILEREAMSTVSKAADDLRFAAGDDMADFSLTELIDAL